MTTQQRKTHKRLLPFYVSRVLEGVIFWFAIEKVFMQSIGFTISSIGLAILAMKVVILCSEVPLGIVADRTSRKGMALFSVFTLGTATYIMAQSSSPAGYMVGLVFFGLYSASSSGLSDSIIYDTVIEEEGIRERYEYYFGRERLLGSIGLVLSSLLGSWVATKWGLSSAYLFTVPFTVLAFITMIGFKEPKLHKNSENSFLVGHLSESFAYLKKSGVIRWIIVASVAIGVLCQTLLELDQLWPLALAMPLIWYGPLNGALLSSYGLAGALAGRLRTWGLAVKSAFVALLACIVALMVAHLGAVVPAQIIAILVAEALLIIANGKMHDQVESRYRAGVSSMVSTITSLAFIPLLLAFTGITDRQSVFVATILLPPIAIVGLVALAKVYRRPA